MTRKKPKPPQPPRKKAARKPSAPTKTKSVLLQASSASENVELASPEPAKVKQQRPARPPKEKGKS
ncbi:MAG: hypothetical protein F4X59_12610 [Holophagales bacterium]|nr:hypothetical protein [Holophagales bacterium]